MGKTLGEMTRAEYDAVVGVALAQLKAELEHPAMAAAIAADIEQRDADERGELHRNRFAAY